MLVDDINEAVPRKATLVAGQDLAVAAWTWKAFNRFPMFINRAFGIVEDNNLIGSIIFTEHNSINAEFSYYSKGELTIGIVRFAAKFALEGLGVERITIRIPRNRRRTGKLLLKLGARVEGVLWCFYGREKSSSNAAVQYVLFRDELTKLAGPSYVRSKMH